MQCECEIWIFRDSTAKYGRNIYLWMYVYKRNIYTYASIATSAYEKKTITTQVWTRAGYTQ